METQRYIKTVGELKEFIKNLPDDMPLVNYQRDMEKRGYQNNVFCSVVNMKKTTRATWDRFDGTPYSYEVFVESKDGISCLEID